MKCMKSRKGFWNAFLIIIVCLPLFSFKYYADEIDSSRDIKTELSSTQSETGTFKEMTEDSIDSSMSTTTTSQLEKEKTEETLSSKEAKKVSKATPLGEKFFVSISDENYALLNNVDGEVINDAHSNYQKTFAAQEISNNSGTKYYLLSTPFREIGYIDPASTKKSTGEEGILFPENNSYASITSVNKKLFTLDFQENGTLNALKDRTVKLGGFYNHFNGTKYYLIKDKSNKSIGVVEEGAIQKSNSSGGVWHSTNQYVIVNRNNWTIWKDFNFENGNSTKNLYGQLYRVTGWYCHFNGTKYLSLYDNKGVWQGYLNENGVEISSPGGKWNSTNQYVTVTKSNWTIWKDFNFKQGSSTKTLYQRTYRVTGWYRHFNGSKYLSVYDNNGKWQGYLNEDGAQVVNNQGGKWNYTNQYITVTKDNWTIWKDFDFKNGISTKNMYLKTYKVTGWYRHFNGSKYLSVYDNNGKWQGYLNEGGAQVVSNQGGKWNSTNQYITVTKNNWTIWKDFNFKNGTSTKNMYLKTYKVTGWYRHFNGSKYLSLYDDKGKWQGYLNEGGTKKAVSYVLLNAPYINQNSSGYPMGCEAASLLQALQKKGYAKNYNLKSFIKEMPLSSNNNPNNGFAGKPDRIMNNVYQSIYAKPLAQWGNKYGKVADISGSSVETLKDELRKGNPVVVYVTGNYAKPDYGKYWWGTGIDNAHIVTLDGYNESNNTYHISDPNSGKYWVSASKFEASYNLRKSAVVVR